MSKWIVKINDGPEQEFATLTGVYRDAAVAAIAMLPFDEGAGPAVVEIWAADLVADYGSLIYRMDVDIYGRRVVTHLLKPRLELR